MPQNWPPPPPRRPDDPFEDLRRLFGQLRERAAGAAGGNGAARPPADPGEGRSPWFFVGIAAVLWLASGFYIVAPDERGIVLRFGAVVREADSGPGYHMPWPIEEVLKPSVTQIRKEEFGFRTVDVGPPAEYRDEDSEALMVTGDENIVKLLFIVQFRIKADANGAVDWLFNVRAPEATVRDAAEAAMREVIGRNKIDDALTEGKDRIQNDAQTLMQQILDRYDAGVEIVTVKLQDVNPPDPVADAFKDVISAQQDRERLINQSRGYANDVVPKARGQAAQILNEAEAYAQTKVRDAEGAASRFVALQTEYSKATEVTRTRMYLETMEEVLGRANLLLLDQSSSRQMVPYLPLDQMLRGGGPEVPQPAEAPSSTEPVSPRTMRGPRG